jgi:hypothetical protein
VAWIARGEQLPEHALPARLAAENRLRLDLAMLDKAPKGKAEVPDRRALVGER